MTERALQVAGWLALCFAFSLALPVFQLFAQDAPKALPGVLDEVVASPGPTARISRGVFADNPGCINAKLDLWTGYGRYSYQLFTGGQTWGDEKTNPATQMMLDGDVTTILIGRAGCRLRIRIDRAE